MSRVTQDLFLRACLFHLVYIFWFHPCYSTYENSFFLKAGPDPTVDHIWFTHVSTHCVMCLMVVCTFAVVLLMLLWAAVVHLWVQGLVLSLFLWVELPLHTGIPFKNWGASAFFTVLVLWRETMTNATLMKGSISLGACLQFQRVCLWALSWEASRHVSGAVAQSFTF